jgi:hypothetical protein
MPSNLPLYLSIVRRRTDPTPWGIWALGWLIAIVLTGGVVYVLTDTESPTRVFKDPVVVETSINEIEVLPEKQLKIDGTLTHLGGTDVVAPALRLPLQFPAGGRATIEEAIVSGARSTIVWDGGRPFVLEGDGAIDLGPIRLGVERDGTATYALSDGVRVLVKGRYLVRTPVAVGTGGLARARDQVDFTADEETTIETQGVAVTKPPASLHLEGPGSLLLDGEFTIRTREGSRSATHLDFGPGPFVLELTPSTDGVRVVGTLQGDVRNVR